MEGLVDYIAPLQNTMVARARSGLSALNSRIFRKRLGHWYYYLYQYSESKNAYQTGI